MARLMPATVLVLNAGSSSLKATAFRMPESEPPIKAPEPIWRGDATWGRNGPGAKVKLWSAKGTSELDLGECRLEEAVGPLVRSLWTGPVAVLEGRKDLHAVGHRVVHGGDRFRRTVCITPKVRAELDELAHFAPKHNRLEAALMQQTEAALGAIPQYAVFDTAFHETLPPAAFTYGGPYDWLTNGIRRYGFHGSSHRYAARRAAEMLGLAAEDANLVTCHLGNGASLAAIRGGRSVDTTMGFTPLEGLLMGTRCGSIDPAILLHLQRRQGLSPDELDKLLNEASGLKGLSGISSDMRDIGAERRKGSERAELAFQCFIHQLCRQIGAMVASVGLPQAIVFTGGIGEHDGDVRAAACSRFEFLGVGLDREKNEHAKPDADLSADGTRVRVLVLQAQEDWEIAKEVRKALPRTG